MSERKSNYDIQADSARELFIKWDQEHMISRFGLEHDKDFLYMDFFSEKYMIRRSTGEVVLEGSGEPADFHALMSIYDVLCYSKEGAAISGEWRALKNLSPHSNFGASGRSLHQREAEKLSGKLEKLKLVCESLGGNPETKADAGYRFDAFTFMPLIFQFWEGDEEFPPSVNFLMDANTMDFIRFETAWYVAGHLLRMINRSM